ncbi:MAG TPA: hypothetical protein VIX86_07095 [Streptosporangiaceae bacterium]
MTVTTTVAGLPRAVAGWAARGRVPAGGLRTAAFVLGGCAAAWFTAGTRPAALTGGCLLAGASLLAQASGQFPGRVLTPAGMAAPGLARARWVEPGMAAAGVARIGRVETGGAVRVWAGAVVAEIIVYGGLAAGTPAAHQRTAWILAITATLLLGARELAAIRTGASGAALGGQCLLAAVIAPAGGPVAALAAAAGWAVIMLGWQSGRTATVTAAGAGSALVVAGRDDGAVACWAGGLTGGRLAPLPPALAGLAATLLLAAAGMRDLPPVLLLAPAAALLLAAPGAGHPHNGRWDWLVPPVLQAAECAYLAALGFARGVPAPVTLALVGLIVLRRRKLCSGLGGAGDGEPGRGPAWAGRAGAGWLGWDGRVLAAGLAAAIGLATLAWLALAAYLGWALCRSALAGRLVTREGEAG